MADNNSEGSSSTRRSSTLKERARENGIAFELELMTIPGFQYTARLHSHKGIFASRSCSSASSTTSRPGFNLLFMFFACVVVAEPESLAKNVDYRINRGHQRSCNRQPTLATSFSATAMDGLSSEGMSPLVVVFVVGAQR